MGGWYSVPMVVRVLLFGGEALAAGAASVEVRVNDRARIEDVRAALGGQCPALAASMGHARLALNHSFARGDEVVSPEDEIALIGLVSGG